MKYLLILVVLFSGCTITQPYVSEYRIVPKIVKIETNNTLCKSKSLKVAQVFTDSDLMTESMNYARGEYEKYSFTESKWASVPISSISSAIVESIRDQNIFFNVSSFKSRSRSDFILESNVENFMQYFSVDNNSSYVKVVIDMALINAKNVKIIQSKKFSKELAVDRLSAKSGVEALNQALSEILNESNRWLYGTCK